MSLNYIRLPTRSKSETCAANAAEHDRIAEMWEMKADNLPPGDPSVQSCRDEAAAHRATALRYRGEA